MSSTDPTISSLTSSTRIEENDFIYTEKDPETHPPQEFSVLERQVDLSAAEAIDPLLISWPCVLHL
jgi:hypothetical protein